MRIREVEELQEFRTLVEEPTEFREGFGWRTILGALFVGFVMMPGSIYLGLVAGQSMGPAAEWTTIILFTEVARRSFQVLSRQEIYILYYIAGGLTAMAGSVALSGGAFAGLIWNQFLRAQAPGGLVDQVPDWVAPPPDSVAIAHRTFMHPDWLPAIGVLLATQVFSRVAWFTLGYSLFRILSDGEKLAFPLAPIAAQGATALAEASSKEETWRWRLFSIGSMMGIGFGLIYLAVPTLTGAILIQPVSILPIPWIDFTQGTERFLPGVPTGIGTNMATFMIGFVLPFWMVAGSFAAAMTTLIVNPIAYVTGHLPTWRPGMETTRTAWAASIDIWLSWGIGTAFAVAGIPLDELILPEVILTLGIVPIAPYAPPSTEELADKVGEYIRCCDAVLLANHGALTVGPDVYGAYYKMETLEHFAHILWIARSLGGPRQLSEEDVRRLMELRERLRISTKNPLCDQCPVLKAAQAFVDGIPLNVPAEESASRISDEELIDKITKMVLKELERS